MSNNDDKFPWGTTLTCIVAAFLIKSCESYRSTPVKATHLRDPQGVEYVVIETRKGEREYLRDTGKGHYLNEDCWIDWLKIMEERKK